MSKPCIAALTGDAQNSPTKQTGTQLGQKGPKGPLVTCHRLSILPKRLAHSGRQSGGYGCQCGDPLQDGHLGVPRRT